MSGKSVLGALLTGAALFFFGFLYWAINPLPYQVWQPVSNPAEVQAAAAGLFPNDGMYGIPGPGTNADAVSLLENGPSLFVFIDHSPAAGAEPAEMAKGLAHNILSAFLLFLLFRIAPILASAQGGLALGVCAAFVINGSEVIWWQQPIAWIIHQALYYVLYFVIAAAILSRFITRPAAH